MIINNNLQTPEKETIEYIRNIAGYFTEVYEDRGLDDSLVFSVTQSEKSKVKNKQKKQKYVSPYSQKGLLIKNITKSKIKSSQRLNAFSKINIQLMVHKEHSPKTRKKSGKSHKYMEIPPLIEKIAHNQLDKIKQEACLLYHIQHKQKVKILAESQRKAKWADFLLRERKWQESRQNKLMEAKHRAISQQKKFHADKFVAKEVPSLNFVQHIRKIKRQKSKLQERLRQLEPNYLSWRNHRYPQRQKFKQIQNQRENVSNEKRIYLSNQKEISFLLER